MLGTGKRTVNIAKFKARMGKYLRFVRAGEELIVLDRNTPIAQVVPISQADALAVEIREPTTSFKEVLKSPRPEKRKVSIDSLAFLLEERRSR